MKKLTFIFLLAVLIAGCANNQSQKIMTEQNAPQTSGNFNEGEIVNKMNEVKNGATPKLKPSEKRSAPISTQNQTASQPPQSQGPQEQQPQTLTSQFTDLTAQYSQAVIKTNKGDITVKFYNQDSPMTVNNFLNLAKLGFYNGTKFHRVIPDFMIQGGDPNSKDDDWSNDGQGGPDYRFADEFNNNKLVLGSLAMANAGPNTNGSQFFIVTAQSTPWLDGKHTNFGQVVEGMNVVEQIAKVQTNENDHPTEDIVIENIELVPIN